MRKVCTATTGDSVSPVERPVDDLQHRRSSFCFLFHFPFGDKLAASLLVGANSWLSPGPGHIWRGFTSSSPGGAAPFRRAPQRPVKEHMWPRGKRDSWRQTSRQMVGHFPSHPCVLEDFLINKESIANVFRDLQTIKY